MEAKMPNYLKFAAIVPERKFYSGTRVDNLKKDVNAFFLKRKVMAC